MNKGQTVAINGNRGVNNEQEVKKVKCEWRVGQKVHSGTL